MKNKIIASSAILMFVLSGIFVPAELAFAQTYSYPSVSVYKTVDKPSVQSSGGDILIYTIHYQNTGNVRLTNANIIDDFDESYLTYDSSDGSHSGSVVSWNIGNLEVGASGTKYLKVKVKDNLSSGTTFIYNKASFNSSETGNRESNQAIVQYTNNYSYGTPSVYLRANGSDGPITVSPNTPITLSWTTNNASSCYASNGWSGTKSISGSENVGYVTSSQTYTINCSGTGGFVSDTVDVNVSNNYNYPYNYTTPCSGSACGAITIEKTGRNLTDNSQGWTHTIPANPGEVVVFQIRITGSGNNVIVREVLPEYVSYRGNLLVDGAPYVGGGNLFGSGLSIGSLPYGQTRIITFEAIVSNSVSGGSKLKNTATVFYGNTSASDNALVCVSSKKIIAIPTYVSTGITDNILLDTFVLPLGITLLIIFIFRSRILRFEEWKDRAKERYQEYKSKKLLSLKVNKIKSKENSSL